MAKKPSGYGVGNVRYGRFSGVNPSRAANQNKTVKARVNELKNLTAETDKMLKEASKNYKLISGKAAYGPKAPSTASKIASAAKGIAGGIARGAMRFAGPAGALASMTTPTGDGREAKPRGPLMSGNKSRGPGGGSLSAPNRTAPSKAAPSRSGGASNSKGPAGPSGARGPTGPQGQSRTSPAGSGKASTSRGPSSGPTSAPSRTAPSKANLGTSRF